MKNKSYTALKMLLLAGAMAFVTSCGGGTEDKKQKLADLKKEREKIDAEIRTLENELRSKGEKLSDEVPGTDVIATAVTPTTFTHYLEIQGKVDADENVTINAEMPGTVTSVFVTTGQAVTRGQILAEIDNATIKSGIAEVEQQLSLARTVYEKQERLWNQKIGTEIQYLTAKNNVESLEKRLATMRDQLNMTRIKSPINGTVDEVLLKPGQVASPGMPGIRIVNLARLKVKAEVAESHVATVKKGSEVQLSFPDLGKEMNSTIDFAGKVINPLNRTFTVEIRITEGMADLRPNMLAVARIADYKKENVIVVPAIAIRKEGKTSFVMVVVEENGKKVAKKRIIKVGSDSAGMVEVTEGLKPGDKVITTGQESLTDGDIVKF